MAIIIHNISGDEFSPNGLNHYEVRINHKVIATFDHVRADGLAECLRIAADAVEDPNRREIKNDQEFLRYLLDTSYPEYRQE